MFQQNVFAIVSLAVGHCWNQVCVQGSSFCRISICNEHPFAVHKATLSFVSPISYPFGMKTTGTDHDLTGAQDKT